MWVRSFNIILHISFFWHAFDFRLLVVLVSLCFLGAGFNCCTIWFMLATINIWCWNQHFACFFARKIFFKLIGTHCVFEADTIVVCLRCMFCVFSSITRWHKPSLQVPRADTRLTVYRPLQVPSGKIRGKWSRNNVTRDADVASALSNTIVRRGTLELMMSYLIWGNILETSIFLCNKPKENRWL